MVTWCESNGGPLVLVPIASLHMWTGTTGDYVRATAVAGLLGILESLDGAQCLVLGDEPLATAFLPESHMLARWCYGDDEDEATDLIAGVLAAADWQDGPLFKVDGPLVMFDAAETGSELDVDADAISVRLGPGVYRVESAFVDPSPDSRFLLHRFVRET